MQVRYGDGFGKPAEDQEAAMMAGLTSSNPVKAAVHRAALSAFPSALAEWADAENQRGTDTPTILIAAVEMQVQIMASIAGQVTGPGAWPILRDAYKELLDKMFVQHAELVRAAMNSEN